MKSYQEFFAELKRRKVFRVAGIYGIVSFGVLQAADLMLPRLGVPDWTVTFMVALVVLAFPVALILAWAFEMTPEGVRKTGAPAAGEIENIVAQPASKRWPAGLMALVGVAALVAGAWWVGRQSSADSGTASEKATPDVRLAFVDPSDDARPSIAVLPFADMSPEADQAYFSDGMTEEILNVLAKIRALRVAARTSTFALRDRELTATQWGDTLQVRYLVEGSVRKSGDQVRITAQLIDTTDGSHLWTDAYTRPLFDVFQIQAEIAEAIADALTVPLGLDEGESLTTPTADLEAYDLYLAGRQQMRTRGDGITEAVKLFEAAIARDSAWAPAWAGLAESRTLIPYYDDITNDSTSWALLLESAEVAALRALELDPNNASATVALGSVYRDSWQWEKAETAYLKALAADPDNVEAHQQYAEYLGYVGRRAEAIEAAQRALSLDRSPIRLNIAGVYAATNGDWEHGLTLMEEGIRLDPDNQVPMLRANVRWSYLRAGRWEDWWRINEGRVDNGRPAFDSLLSVWPAPGPPPEGMDIANLPWFGHGSKTVMAAILGQHDVALDQMLQSYAGRPPYGDSGGLFNTLYDPIRDDSRFQELLASRNLAGRVPIRTLPEEE